MLESIKPPTDSWEDILNCSQNLLDMAEQSKWGDMSDIASQRDTMLKKYFSDNPSNEKNAVQHQRKIKEILELDKYILNFYDKDHANLSENILSLRNSSKALNAYHNCP